MPDVAPGTAPEATLHVDARHGHGTQVGDGNLQVNQHSISQDTHQNIHATGQVKIVNRRMAIRLPGLQLNLSVGQIAVALLSVAGLAGGGAVAVNAVASPTSVVDKSVGDWNLGHAMPANGGTAESLVLSIRSGGTYHLVVVFTGTSNGASQTVICDGDVGVRGAVMVFTPFERVRDNITCNTFTATTDGQNLTIQAGTQLITLHRT
jgi:hypothetical protein